MGEEGQSDVVAFLRKRCIAAGDTTPPVATHISRIFFAGRTVYKLKRAVRTPYLDFSTPALRLAACAAEVALNRRTAPSLYRGVRRITRESDGFALDGSGPVVDAIVEMNRFDSAALFDAMATAGTLAPAHMEALARKLASFHSAAERRDGGADRVRAVIALNEAALGATFLAQSPVFAAACDGARALLARCASTIDARARAGKVRRCHGDLTLRNIALIDGAPTPFDCLEFDEALASVDVLYDLAFTLMDLLHRDRPMLANTLMNRYLDAADETDGLALLPLFIAMRAMIRAHVTATMSSDETGFARANLRAEADAYLSLAMTTMKPAAPALIGIGGLSGSGKSSVAAALAPLMRPVPGARVVSSDRIRKAMFSVAPTDRLPAEAYASSVSEQVYAMARAQAARCLAQGWPVIADAVFDRAEDRAALERVANDAGVAFLGVWLEAPPTALAQRVAARTGDPSDATVEVLAAQQARLAARGEAILWASVDATRTPQDTATAIAARLYSAGSRASG